ncbi:MAG: DMT family transporter [Desulfarculaceae bacterium]|nr:DMT family transporter [Desulfarculaceae bacterium]
MKHLNKQILPYLTLLCATVLWASSFVALKIAFRNFDPMVVIFSRMLVGSICFLFLYRFYKNTAIHKKDLFSLFLMVLFEPCLYFVFEAKAIQYTTASQAGMVSAFLPMLVAVGAFFVLKENLTPKIVTGLFISIVGVCWLSMAGTPALDAPNPALGNFYEFLAMVFAAGYTIVLKKLTNSRYSALFLTAIQAFAGSIFYLPILFLPSTELPVTFDPVSFGAIIYLGSAVTLGAYACFNYGVSKIPAGRASAFVNLIPVFSLFMGIIILGDSFTPQQCAACLIIFSGLLVSQDVKLNGLKKFVPAGLKRLN